MKNIITILTSSLLFLSCGAFAKTQTMILGSDEKPVTVSVGGNLGAGGYSISKDKHGMGLKHLSGFIGVTHYVGHNFEYGLDANLGWATSLSGKLFNKESNADGFKASGNLHARYMRPLTESMKIGGLVDVGYGRLFGEGNKNFNKGFAFGDMSFNVGPTFSHQATESFSWGLGLTYGMSDMRFAAKAGTPERELKILKQYSNLHTVRLPIEFFAQASELVGVAFGLVPGWKYLGDNHKFYHGIFYDAYVDAVIRF